MACAEPNLIGAKIFVILVLVTATSLGQKEPDLFFCDSQVRAIFWLNTATGKMTRFLTDDSGPLHASAYDSVNKYVYWTAGNVIRRKSMLSGDEQLIFDGATNNIEEIRDLILDKTSHMLYYINEDYIIGAVSTSGKDHRTLRINSERVNQIALDPVNRWIYFTMDSLHVFGSTVARINADDGTGLEVFNTGCYYSHGIDLDVDGDWLYFTCTDKCMRARLNGTDLQLFYNYSSWEYADHIALTANYLYFNRRNETGYDYVAKLDLSTQEVSVASSFSFGWLTDIAMGDTLLSTDVDECASISCQNKGTCDLGNSISCLCDDGDSGTGCGTHILASDLALRTIYWIDATTGQRTRLFTNDYVPYLYAAVYDSVNKYLYWAAGKWIRRKSILSGEEQLIFDGDDDVLDVTLDKTSQTLYYSTMSGIIGSVSTDGTNPRTQRVNLTADDIALDPVNRWIYFINYEEDTVSRINADNGAGLEVLSTGCGDNSGYIEDIDLDIDGDWIYYTCRTWDNDNDYDNGMIMRAHLDGTDRQLFYNGSEFRKPRSIALTANYLYVVEDFSNFPDLSGYVLVKLNLNTKEVSNVTNFVFPGLFDITIGSTSTECNDICPELYDPVCGSDRKTYGNRCRMESSACRQNKTIYVAYRGECTEDTSPAAVTPKNPTCAEKFAAKYPERVQQETSKPKLVCRRRV